MFKKKFTIPVLSNAENTYKSMHPSERWIFYILSSVFMVSTLVLISFIYISITVPTPQNGGKIIDGVIGAPRFVNPVLAISIADKDLSQLIYAGLMSTGKDGQLVKELAESYSISDDAKEYTFTLYKDLTFHDGVALTVDDIIFTIDKAMQPDIKSPERANWEGVTVEKVDDYTIKFLLDTPYAQFLQNTTLGILPQEHWGKLSADEFIFSKLNTSPIGSGPYKFVSAKHDSSGIPSSFNLTKFKDFVLGEPYIDKITINFYPDKNAIEAAFKSNSITSMSEVSPNKVSELSKNNEHRVLTSTLPRIFAVFFNQSHNELLTDKTLRSVLRDVIDKEALVNNVLEGYAIPLHSLLLGEGGPKNSSFITPQQAREQLEQAGWELNEADGYYYNSKDQVLSLTLTTVNSAELKAVANYITKAWSAIGVQVKLEVFESGTLTQSILRTRKYDALLFGEIVGTNPDPYAFWHSSQRNDPGLNIANYANSSVDKLLIKARKTIDNQDRTEIYEKVAKEINKDIPAIFLYAPSFIYITNSNVKGINFAPTMEPHSRFSTVHLWHINTSRTWNFLTN